MLTDKAQAAFAIELEQQFGAWQGRTDKDKPRQIAEAAEALLEAAGAAPNTAWQWCGDVDVKDHLETVFLGAANVGAGFGWEGMADHIAAEYLVETGAPAAGELNEDWTARPRPREWLLPGWLPSGRIAMLTGTGGNGKSRLAIQLAGAIAAGDTTWLSGGPELATAAPATAILATWEDDKDEVARRLRAARGGDEAPGDVGNRFVRVGMAGRGPIWEPNRGGSGHISTIASITPSGAWLRAYAARRKARLLILDPLAAAFASDENSRAHVRRFLADWDAWGQAAGCSVLLVSHPPKSDAKYAGSTDWQAGVRALLSLEYVETGTGDEDADNKGKRKPAPAPRLSLDKASYAGPADPLWLEATTGGPWRVAMNAAAAARNCDRGRGAAGGETGNGKPRYV